MKHFLDFRMESKVIGAVLLLITACGIIGSIIYTGGPVKQQKLKQDIERVNALARIHNMIQDEYRYSEITRGAELNENISKELNVSKVKYVFLSKDKYELCTNFELDTREERNLPQIEYYSEQELRRHPKGFVCFTFDY